MRDILGREIEYGDLVVAKATGRNSSGLHIGVSIGKSVRFRSGKVASYGEMFKVVQPTEKELEIKNEITKAIEKDKKAKELELNRRKSLKAIPKKNLVIGKEYKTDNGNKVIYLGEGEVKHETRRTKNDYYTKKSNEIGIIILNEYYYEDKKGFNFDTFIKYTVRKTMPRFIEETGFKVDIENKEFEFNNTDKIENNYRRYWRPNIEKIKFILK